MTDHREAAARALCRKAGNPENTMFEGRPMWMSYLDDVDTVVGAIGKPFAIREFWVAVSPEGEIDIDRLGTTKADCRLSTAEKRSGWFVAEATLTAKKG